MKLDKMILKFIWKNKLLIMPEKVKKKTIMSGNCFYSTSLTNNFQSGLCMCVCGYVCVCMCAFILLWAIGMFQRKEKETLQELLRREDVIQK